MKHQIQRPREPVKRIQQNLLAASERRLLNWLCSRLPPWVTPDRLTAAGMVGALAVFAGYCMSAIHVAWLWLAIGGYVLQWFGDSLDGSLARYRQIELGELKLSHVGAGPTELRLVLIALTVAMMALGSGPGFFAPLSGFDLFVGSGGILLILLFVVQTLVTARRLAAQEK